MLLSMSLLCFPEEYVIVVNKANPVQEIAAQDLKKMFLGEKMSWEDGSQIKLAALDSGELQGVFVRDILKMTRMQFQIHWKKMIFTGSGTGTDIKFFKSEQKVKEYVAANPGAIGYISASSVDDTIKPTFLEKR